MAEKKRVSVEPDMEFLQGVLDDGGESLKKCFQCGTCSVVCNLAKEGNPFPRKEMVWAQWGLKDRLMADPNIWNCYHCADCTAYCPRGATPGDVLAAVRKKVIESLAWPSFMGKALSDAHYWIWLFVAPAIILGAIVLVNVARGAELTPVIYGNFINHLQMNAVFLTLSGLVLVAFAVGIYRMWTGALQAAGGASKMELPRLVTSIKDVVIEIITHRDFGQCETNKWRKTAHFLVFYGFMGLLLTTVLAIAVLFVYEYWNLIFGGEGHNTALGHYPMVFYHPVKWVGNASAAALIIGAGLMIVSRRKMAEEGDIINSNFDNFFLWDIFLVGVTGFFAQLLRFLDVPILAYPTYFIHLLLVFALLIYAPYSKFAHLAYRTAGLVYNRYQELSGEEQSKEETAAEVEAEAA